MEAFISDGESEQSEFTLTQLGEQNLNGSGIMWRKSVHSRRKSC